jgi:hypothetical protein
MKIKLIDENLGNQKGLSKYSNPESGWEKDITDYDVAIYTDAMGHKQTLDKTKINCSWIIEPPVINGENYGNILNKKDEFKYIFTHIKNIANSVDNGVFIPHGGIWIEDSDILIHPKTKMTSSIFSWKTWNHHHRMRFRVYDRLKDDGRVDFYGTGCEKPIDNKIEALKDYRFSITIENSVEEDYFTEKLLDCFLTGTIPIYIGTRTTKNYFDENGIIFFDEDENLPQILDTLTEELYLEKFESVKTNFELAKKYIHPEKIINEFLKEKINV